jgi:hypothetical protein
VAQLPHELVRHDPELAAVVAVSRVLDGDLEAAEKYRRLAEAIAATAPEGRQGWLAAVLTETRLYQARVNPEPRRVFVALR